MTATERAKRSDALYYETVSVTRRVLCDMIANREGDIDELQNRIERLERNRGRLIGESYRLGTENARLRELVDYMTPIAWYEASERERDRMRELGVEVDA